jgi:hypothetical protein
LLFVFGKVNTADNFADNGEVLLRRDDDDF